MSDKEEHLFTPKTLKVADLKKHLSALNLPTQGLKKDLTQRLEEALADDSNLDQLSRELYDGMPLTTPDRKEAFTKQPVPHPNLDDIKEDENEAEEQSGSETAKKSGGRRSRSSTRTPLNKKTKKSTAEAMLHVEEPIPEVQEQVAEDSKDTEESIEIEPGKRKRADSKTQPKKEQLSPRRKKVVENQEVEQEKSEKKIEEPTGEVKSVSHSDDVISSEKKRQLEEEDSSKTKEKKKASKISIDNQGLKELQKSILSKTHTIKEKDQHKAEHEKAKSPKKVLQKLDNSAAKEKQTCSDQPSKEIKAGNKGIENASVLQSTPEPKFPVSRCLYILNFVRPLRVQDVQELLSSFGTVENFWMNSIKSHCLVKYEKEEFSEKARSSLSGKKWPEETGKMLEVDFVEVERYEKLVEEETRAEKEGKHLILSVVDGNLELISSSGRKVSQASVSTTSTSRKQSEDTLQLPGKVANRKVVSLDEIFKKTKTEPHLYYLPVAEEAVQERRKELEKPSSRRRSRSRSRSPYKSRKESYSKRERSRESRDPPKRPRKD